MSVTGNENDEYSNSAASYFRSSQVSVHNQINFSKVTSR